MRVSLSSLSGLLCMTFLLIGGGEGRGQNQDLFDGFSFGVGSRLSWDNPVGSGSWLNARYTTDLLEANGVGPEHCRYIAFWMVPGWQPFWFSAEDIQTYVIDRGYTPIFIHWWFGDNTTISYMSDPTNQTNYYADLDRAGDFLNALSGEVLFVLEPEHNTDSTDGINTWTKFSQILLEGRSRILDRIDSTNLVIRFGTAPGAWDAPAALDLSIGAFNEVADFVGLQSIYGSTRNSEATVLASADLMAQRLQEYFDFYGKPTCVPYFAISTYLDGDGLGWSNIQQQVVTRYHELAPELHANAGTFAIAYMALADDPNQQGYFGAAEPWLGLLQTNFVLKPSFDAFFASANPNGAEHPDIVNVSSAGWIRFKEVTGASQYFMSYSTNLTSGTWETNMVINPISAKGFGYLNVTTDLPSVDTFYRLESQP